MDIFFPNLHKHRSTLGQQFPRHRQPVAQVAQIRVNPVAPSVAEGFYLLGFPGDVVGLAILDIAARGGPLEIRIELDAIRGVDIDALHLAAQALAFGERGHHPQAVAKDHAVRPVGVVAVELGAGAVVGQAVEIGEQIDLRIAFALALFRSAHKIVDQRFGMHLLLDIQRWRVDHEFRLFPGILPRTDLNTLAAPDKLRVQIGIAPLISHPQRRLLIQINQSLGLRRRNILPLRIAVLDRINSLVLQRPAPRHWSSSIFRYAACGTVFRCLDSVVFLNRFTDLSHAATRHKIFRLKSSCEANEDTISPPTSDNLAKSARGISD